MSRLTLSNNLDIEVALGLVPGWTSFRKFGYNDDIDSGTEEIWTVGTPRTLPTSAAVAAVVSTSQNDGNVAGDDSGALEVTIEGLDSNWDSVTDTVTTNGTTPANSTQTFLRINRMYVSSAGSNEANAGTITASVSGNDQITIPANHGQSEIASFSVPRGYKVVLSKVAASFGKETSGDQAILIGQFKPSTATSWRAATGLPLYQSTYAFEPYVVIPEKTDFRMLVISDFVNLECGVVLYGYTIRNDAINV